MAYKNDNDNYHLDVFEKAESGFGQVEVRPGCVVDLVMATVVAAAIYKNFVCRPYLFLGFPEMEWDSKIPYLRHLLPRSAAKWACEDTKFAKRLPGIIKASGASERPRDALPFVISALARYEPFLTAVAFRCQGAVDPLAIAEEKLHGYLERYGFRLVFEVLDQFSTPAASCRLVLRQLRKMIIEHHMATKVGKLMPMGGLSVLQIDEVLEEWMVLHDYSIHELLGFSSFESEDA